MLSVALCLSTSACSSVGLSVDNMMHPPKATGDKAQIQSLIDSVAGEGYSLKYPQSGSYRSAITIKDIDSDNTDEAVAFYLPAGDIATVHMLLMDNIDGQWQSVGDFKSTNTAVQSLEFCDLDGNGILEIATNWKTYNPSVNQLSVHIYDENKLRELSTEYNCSNLLTGDFTGEPGEELMLLSLFSTDKEASASLIDINDNKSDLELKGTTAMDPDVVSYTQLLSGNIFENQYGVVVDGCTSKGSYNTQILYFNTYFNSLERISFTENAPYNQALRSDNVVSKDINGDSVIEVPATFRFNIEEDRNDVVATAEIYWCQQTEDGMVLLIEHQVASFAYGFTFNIPQSWEGLFTAHTDFNKNEVTFYKWNKDKTGDALMTIKISDKDTFSETEGFSALAESENRVYTYRIFNPDDNLAVSDSEVKDSFELM